MELTAVIVETIRNRYRSILKAVLGKLRLYGRRTAASEVDTGTRWSGAFDVPPTSRRASAGPDNERTQAHNAPRALSSRLSVINRFVQ